MSTKKPLTTNAGCPVVDNQNVMTAGPLAHSCCRTGGFWRNSPTSTAK